LEASRQNKIADAQSFYTSMISVVYVMVLTGIISPHLSIKVLEEEGLLWVSLLTLGFMVARSTASLIHAPLYRKYSARLIGGLGLSMLITSYYLYSILPPLYYPVLQMLTGFSSGLFWPLMQSLLAHGLSPSWRSRGFSLYFIVGAIASYAGYQIGSLIYVFLGPQYIFVTAYISGLAYLALFLRIAPRQKLNVKVSRYSLELRTGFRELGGLVPLTILVGGVNGLLKDYLIAYTKLITGYSEPVIRNMWSIAGYIGLALSYLASYIQEKMHMEKQVLVTGTSMLLLLLLLLPLRNPYTVFTIIALAITGSRMLRPVIRGIATNRTREPETAIAIINSLSNVSAALTPFVLALLSSIVI